MNNSKQLKMKAKNKKASNKHNIKKYATANIRNLNTSQKKAENMTTVANKRTQFVESCLKSSTRLFCFGFFFLSAQVLNCIVAEHKKIMNCYWHNQSCLTPVSFTLIE